MGGGYAQGRAAGVRETPLGIGCRDLISSLFCPMGSHLFPARPAPSPPSPQRLGGRSPARSGPIGRSPPASFLALLRRYFSRIPGLCIGFSGLDREPSGLDLDRRPSRKIRAPSAMSANVRLAAMQPQRSFLASPSAAWPGPAAPGPFPACPAPTSGLPGATAGLFPPLPGPSRTPLPVSPSPNSYISPGPREGAGIAASPILAAGRKKPTAWVPDAGPASHLSHPTFPVFRGP